MGLVLFYQMSQYASEFKNVLKSPRKSILAALNILCMVCTPLMMYDTIKVVVSSDIPVVVVMSGSMEPSFHRGDILLLEMMNPPFSSGDIPVFSIEGKDIPIVHRSISVHAGEAEESLAILTKGDNNNLDDRGLYNRGQHFIAPKNMIGRARGFIPYFGMIPVWAADYPWLKYALLGFIAFLGFIDRES